jgi:hypothetical protein
MKNPLDNEIKQAERNLQILRDKQRAQMYEIPPIEKRAKGMVKAGFSEAYIQSCLYASRTSNIGIYDIVEAIKKAKAEIVLDKV